METVSRGVYPGASEESEPGVNEPGFARGHMERDE